ncbi:MAG: TIGR00725 family protein [Dehalococcoidales bacterium]|nr:TIGR00725 family protein [Dehalococcoidales bacterium]
MKNRKFIAVIGSGQATKEEAELAEAVGQEIAKRGAVLICGGLGGVMEAACKGAVEAGGMTIGIIPGDSRLAANPYVLFPIVTGMSQARNVIIIKSAHAVIAVGGAYGTLSEIGHALQNHIPVIGLQTWQIMKNENIDPSIIITKNPAKAVDIAFNLI